MEYITDLHLHSKYSRAVSQNMTIPTMAEWAEKKGIDVLTTSDFTHPLWLREIKSQLEEAYEGVYRLRSTDYGKTTAVDSSQSSASQKEVFFLLTTEIASIYKQGEKLRRIHNLLFAPSIEVVEKLNQELVKRGCNLGSDGRPIIGLSSKQLLELALEVDRKIILIPCHAWTPHFGIYGSASGFDSLQEAFGDLSKFVYGIETGISSDPFMNWQIPELENRAILSFSDAHSAPKMGREATVFKLPKLSYLDFGKAIARPNENCKIVYTLEFYPEEGKYHHSGHRNCNVSLTPSEIKKNGSVCPVCSRRLTEGVMIRVQQVAGRQISTDEPVPNQDERGVNWIKDPKNIHPPFVKLVPLLEIVAEGLSSTVSSEKVKMLFEKLCKELGSEINVLLKSSEEDIRKVGGEKVAQGVMKVRKGDILIEPGFDGEYGKVKIWNEEQLESNKMEEKREQMGLF